MLDEAVAGGRVARRVRVEDDRGHARLRRQRLERARVDAAHDAVSIVSHSWPAIDSRLTTGFWKQGVVPALLVSVPMKRHFE